MITIITYYFYYYFLFAFIVFKKKLCKRKALQPPSCLRLEDGGKQWHVAIVVLCWQSLSYGCHIL